MPSSTPAKTRPREASAQTPSPHLPERDVRRKRPPLMSFLLRMDTLRSAARVVALLALDFAGLFAAIFTALALKDAVLGDFVARESFDQAREFVAFVFLITVLL